MEIGRDLPLFSIAWRPGLNFASVFASQKMNNEDAKYLFLCVFVVKIPVRPLRTGFEPKRLPP